MHAEKEQPPILQSAQGYLLVAVSTARGAIPLENASVHVRASDESNQPLAFSLLTNRDGKTQKLALPAPDVKLSQSPQNGDRQQPYAKYHIDVYKEGYFRQLYENVPIFAGITSIQPAILIPLPEKREENPQSPQEPRVFFGEEPNL